MIAWKWHEMATGACFPQVKLVKGLKKCKCTACVAEVAIRPSMARRIRKCWAKCEKAHISLSRSIGGISHKILGFTEFLSFVRFSIGHFLPDHPWLGKIWGSLILFGPRPKIEHVDICSHGHTRYRFNRIYDDPLYDGPTFTHFPGCKEADWNAFEVWAWAQVPRLKLYGGGFVQEVLDDRNILINLHYMRYDVYIYMYDIYIYI